MFTESKGSPQGGAAAAVPEISFPSARIVYDWMWKTSSSAACRLFGWSLQTLHANFSRGCIFFFLPSNLHGPDVQLACQQLNRTTGAVRLLILDRYFLSSGTDNWAGVWPVTSTNGTVRLLFLIRIAWQAAEVMADESGVEQPPISVVFSTFSVLGPDVVH